eukprot:Rmarinus@m.24467
MASKYLGYSCVKGFDSNSDVYWTRENVDKKLRELQGSQRICQYPAMTSFCHKVKLAELLESVGSSNIQPKFWVLPKQCETVLQEMMNHRLVIIVKPDKGSEGKNIFVTDSPTSLKSYVDRAAAKGSSHRFIAQTYINPPMLLKGFKFDFRVYVLVASLDPLRVYVCREGFARVCPLPYKSEFGEKFDPGRHLTNYSLNKSDPNFDIDRCKRPIAAMLEALIAEKKLKSVTTFWDEVDSLALATCAAMTTDLKKESQRKKLSHSNCFQVLGFDILLDAKGKCSLLEVNARPRLGIDKMVKPEDVTSDDIILDKTKPEKELCFSDGRLPICNCKQANFKHYHVISRVDLDSKKPAVAGALSIVRGEAARAVGIRHVPSQAEAKMMGTYVVPSVHVPLDIRRPVSSLTAALARRAELGIGSKVVTSNPKEEMCFLEALAKAPGELKQHMESKEPEKPKQSFGHAVKTKGPRKLKERSSNAPGRTEG